MLSSPFAFYRGGAAIMAMDLASMPTTGLTVQLCGDAHLANFGMYASPERELVFDINDFDETLPGPFEWDVKRLAASFVVAARTNHFSVAQSRAAALAAVAAYRGAMLRFAGLGNLAIWYTHLTVDDITGMLADPKQQKNVQNWITKARSNTSMRALAKLTTVQDGRRRIVDDPPLIERMPPELVGKDIGSLLTTAFDEYLKGLDPDRQHLLQQYTAVDVARKVVGVGSVGTRCYIVLLEGRNVEDPLFLQVKEAEASVLEPYAGKSQYPNNGQRVVVGQRRMQAASDIFLGWVRGIEGRDFYWRQLQDLKGSVPIESVTPADWMCMRACVARRWPAPTRVQATACRLRHILAPVPASMKRLPALRRPMPTRRRTIIAYWSPATSKGAFQRCSGNDRNGAGRRLPVTRGVHDRARRLTAREPVPAKPARLGDRVMPVDSAAQNAW